MAYISLSPSLLSTLPSSGSTSSSFPLPSNPKLHYVSKETKKLACKAKHSPHPQNANQEEQQPPLILGNRRDVLLGLGSLCGAAATFSSSNPNAFAAPITPPDLTTCGPPDLPAGAKPVNCCPPASTKIIDFKFPSPKEPLRVRPAVQSVNSDYLAKYRKAVELMKGLPSDDPRNFTQQANVHCAYCDGAYNQVGFPDLDLQVHSSWLFFPYHRWYLYFHEKILGSLIGDPTFALPFWNWDSPKGMSMPDIFTNSKSSLYDPLRSESHQPPTLIDLNYNTESTDNPSVPSNLAIMYRQMVSNAKTPR